MTIGFLCVDTNTPDSVEAYQCAKAMVKSARRAMPKVDIVQFTDLTSPVVQGVRHVRRKPREPMGLLRMRHCAGVPGDWLFVDTDILFQHPVTSVFKREFDVAVTSRDWSHLKVAQGFSERMPFNTGVVFSRRPSFWADCYLRLRDFDQDQQRFMGEQQVICALSGETDRYHVVHLKGSLYNFPPEVPGITPSQQEQMSAAHILHFKGRARKALMLKRRKQETRCA